MSFHPTINIIIIITAVLPVSIRATPNLAAIAIIRAIITFMVWLMMLHKCGCDGSLHACWGICGWR